VGIGNGLWGEAEEGNEILDKEVVEAGKREENSPRGRGALLAMVDGRGD
jgi:hypothetical protein